jgi:hypothetical protein
MTLAWQLVVVTAVAAGACLLWGNDSAAQVFAIAVGVVLAAPLADRLGSR